MPDYFHTQDLIASFEPSLSLEVFDDRRDVIEARIAAHRGRSRACGAGGLV